MSFDPLSSLAGSLRVAPPPCKRRKLSDPVGDLFQKTRKRSAELPNENGEPFKRRKVERNAHSIHSEASKMEDGPSVDKMEYAPLMKTSRKVSQMDRFIPRAMNKGLCDSNLDTPYKKHLASVVSHSKHPSDQKMLRFSSQKEKKKLPDDSCIHKPSSDSIQQQVCTSKKICSAVGLQDDVYSQALAYNQHQDCLAIILNSSVFLKRKGLHYEVPLHSTHPPTALAFTPEGTTLLVSLNNGSLGSFDLVFDQDRLSSSLAWEGNVLRSEGCEQKNHLLISEVYVFIGTEDGRICRISRSNGYEYAFYENRENDRILGLALSPDGRFLLTASATGRITLFDVNMPRPLHQLQLIEAEVKALAFSPCGNFFVAGGGEGDPRVSLCSIENQRMKEILTYYTGSEATALFWRKDYVLSTHRDGRIRTFSVNPNRSSLLDPPLHHKTPVLDKRLSYAALKHNKGSDTLFVGCASTDELLEIEIQASHQKRQGTSTSFCPAYNTIR